VKDVDCAMRRQLPDHQLRVPRATNVPRAPGGVKVSRPSVGPKKLGGSMDINWSIEWLTSLLWIARVFLFVVIGFALIAWLLIRRTRWGRQFWRLSGAYFIPRQRTWLSWRPILTVALLLLLTVIGVRINVLLTYQSNGLYTALQNRSTSYSSW
jgi:hypothetical protein